MNALPEGDALALAQLVRDGEVTPAELLDAAISATQRLNPTLNAIVRPLYDEARHTLDAGVGNGPFAGVPYLIKDLLADYAGVPTTSGSRFTSEYVPANDAELVARSKAAGLVIFGKTNTPEFGLTPFTEPALFGPARNPWDTERTPGGSSGGSGAAIAAGLVPMAGGGDGGGSIRIPASCCGLVGLKPSRGRNPTGPDRGDIWFGAVVEHPLTRSVRDTAAALDALSGPDVGAPRHAPKPEQSFLASLDTPVRPLRIAVTTQPMLADHMDRECVRGAEATAQLLESLGHTVEIAHPPIDRDAFVQAFLVLLVAETAADIGEYTDKLGHAPRRGELEPATEALVRLGRVHSAEELTRALRELQAQTRRIAAWMADYDVMLAPTLAEPPFIIGSYQPSRRDTLAMAALNRLPLAGLAKRSGLVEQMAQDIFRFIPNTPVANVTGEPAISLPLHWSPDGLPVGMMFTAPLGDEITLLQLARQLEQAQPWAQRRPPIHARADA